MNSKVTLCSFQACARGARLLLAVAVFVVGLLHCAALRKLSDPVTGLVRRGSCISIDLPPITLTPERTAAERQLVGENRELEPDGWLLASAQSAARYGREGGRVAALKEVQRLYRERAVLEYYQGFLAELLGRGALGETTQGTLVVVPAGVLGGAAARITRGDRRRAAVVSVEVNRARQWIYEYHLGLSRAAGKDPKAVANRWLRSYWERAPQGTWVRNPDGRWVRRQ